MSAHNIGFHGEIMKIVLKLSSNTHLISSTDTVVNPASILRKSTSGRHRPVSYPDGPMTARYRFT